MLTDIERTRMVLAQEKTLKSGRVARNLVRAFCVDCIYDPLAEGSAKAQIAACTAEACPFHPIRHLWAGDPPTEGASGDGA